MRSVCPCKKFYKMEDDRDKPWNLHTCKSCTYRSKSTFVMCQHVRLHRTRSKTDTFLCDAKTPELYECKFCEFGTHLKVDLTEHFRIFHEGKESNKELEDIVKCFRCKYCDFETHSVLVLAQHADDCNVVGDEYRKMSKRQCHLLAQKDNRDFQISKEQRRNIKKLRRTLENSIDKETLKKSKNRLQNHLTGKRRKECEETSRLNELVEDRLSESEEPFSGGSSDEYVGSSHSSGSTVSQGFSETSQLLKQRKRVPFPRGEFESDEQNLTTPLILQHTLAVTQTTSGKKHCCYYCSKLYVEISNHLIRIHAKEPEMTKIIEMQVHSRERILALKELRVKGDDKYNKQVAPSQRIVARKSTKSSIQSCITCRYCLQLLSSKNFARHVRQCAGDTEVSKRKYRLRKDNRDFQISKKRRRKIKKSGGMLGNPSDKKTEKHKKHKGRLSKLGEDGISESEKESSSGGSSDEYASSRSSASTVSQDFVETSQLKKRKKVYPLRLKKLKKVLPSAGDGANSRPELTTRLNPQPTFTATQKTSGKKHCCYYCGGMYVDISRHLIQMHGKEPEVAKVREMQLNSKERKLALKKLRINGNANYNKQVAPSQRIVARKLTRSSVQSCITCRYCLQLLTYKNFGRHVRRCAGKETSESHMRQFQNVPNEERRDERDEGELNELEFGESEETPFSGKSTKRKRVSFSAGDGLNLKRKSKKHCCYYCDGMYVEMSSHLIKMHAKEPEIVKITKMQLNSKERNLALKELRVKGDDRYNKQVAPSQRITARKLVTSSIQSCVTCQRCLQLLAFNNFARHERRCSGRPANYRRVAVQALAADPERLMMGNTGSDTSQDKFIEELLKPIQAEYRKHEIASDPCLKALAERYTLTNRGNPTALKNVRHQLRRMARLLLEIKEIAPTILNFKDCILDGNYDCLLEAVYKICSFDYETGVFGKPALAQVLRGSITVLLNVLSNSYLLDHCSKDSGEYQKVKRFMNINEQNHDAYVSRSSRPTRL